MAMFGLRFGVLGCAVGALILSAGAAEVSKGDPSIFKSNKSLWGEQTVYEATTFDTTTGVKAIAIEGDAFKNVRKTRVFAYWGLPEGASADHKVPAIVLVHGGGGSAIASWVDLWRKRGYAAISMDTCGAVPTYEKALGGRLRSKYAGPSGPYLFWESADKLKDQWPYHAVAAVIRCHSFLRSRPEIDAARIGITGISWGGFLTAATIGVDDRFAFAAPIYGSGYLIERSAMKQQLEAYGEKGPLWAALWDPSNYLPHATKPVLCAVGANDIHFALDSFQRSYDLVKGPLQRAIRPAMSHDHPPAGDPAEITAFANHICFGAPALPKITGKVAAGKMTAEWKAFGRTIKKVSLCSTDQPMSDWPKQKFVEKSVAFTGDKVVCAVPATAKLFWINITTDDGLVASTRYFTQEELGK